MYIQSVTFSASIFEITWDNAEEHRYPAIFLRDNDPGELHPQTRERVFDLTTVSLDIEPIKISFTDEALEILWPDKSTSSIYTSEWLMQHRPGVPRKDDAEVKQQTWDAGFSESVPWFKANECRVDSKQLRELLRAIKRYGLVIVSELEEYANAGTGFGESIGFKRMNNFGSVFHVVNKPDPNNLAYTSVALPLHTDLPNQELIPGYQFFHCYQNAASGGDSIYADGFKICEDMRVEEPDYFDTLTNTHVPFRFHDEKYDIRSKRPLIQLDVQGNVSEFVFNAHLVDVPDMPETEMLEFYAAYQSLMKRIRSDRYNIRIRLQPGAMAIVDNRRVMHGRGEFDPQSGERQLQGYYIDYGELDSRMRLISQTVR